jgi:tetratricopeptide (TPR) repeat protein
MKDPKLAHEQYLRGLDVEEADRRAAKTAYEACLAGDCSHLEARINLGRLLHLEGSHADAEAIYRDTQETDATLFFNLAVLMEDLDREIDAVKYYQEAIVHEPGLADAHFNLAILQERRGELQSAYRHLLAYHRLIRAHQNPTYFAPAELD